MRRPDVEVHEDDRGRLVCVWRGRDFEEINFLQIRAGASRGGHYHRENLELMVVTKGRLALRVEDVEGGEVEEVEVEEGDAFLIEPYERHTLTALTDASLVSCNTVPPFDADEPDVVRD